MGAATLRCLLLAAVLIQAGARPSYRSILETYRAGNREAAIAALAEYEHLEVAKKLQQLIKDEHDRVRRDGGPRVWLQTAALVHLEYALVHGSTIYTFNGRGTGRDQSWIPVRALYDPPRGRRPEGPGTDHAFLVAWFRFMVVDATAHGRWPFALEIFREGRAQVGDDPELLLAAAALHEVAWRREHEEEQPNQPVHGDLAAAETLLQRAIEVDPALDEARLRLGRVQTKRGELPAALATLAPLQSLRTEPAFVFLARLFEGDAYEAVPDLPKAEAAYRAAIAAMATGQSARLALANVLHKSGRRDDAANGVVAVATGARSDATDDPWVHYALGVAWRRANYLAALRVTVR